MFNRRIYHSIILTITIICLLGFLFYYLFFTTKGSTSITKLVVSKYIKSGDFDIKKTDGSLFRELIFQDIEIIDFKGLPSGSIIKLKKLDINLTSLNPEGLSLKVHNGKLELPDSEPLFFYGIYKDSLLDINFYSRRLDVKKLLVLFSGSNNFKYPSGLVTDFDGTAKGPLGELELSGKFQIEKLIKNGFSMLECPAVFTININDAKDKSKLFGEIEFRDGIILARNTRIQLKQCKILFSGDPKLPSLNFNGTSTIEGIKINIVLKGIMDTPDLKLTSVPSLPQEQLLVMLVTGKSWEATQASLSKGQISPELAKDFIEYYIFSGLGNKIAQQFGLTSLTFKYNNRSKGIGVEKNMTDKVKASYIIEQPQVKDEQSTKTQKLGGEYKITENISIEAEKEIKQNNKSDENQQKLNTDDKALLKYKKEF